jgi:hypothetical protein
MQIYLVDVQGCCICTLCVLKKLKILIWINIWIQAAYLGFFKWR